MKKIIYLTAIFCLTAFLKIEAKPFQAEISFGIFYSSLSPHGEWIQMDNDLIVWRPTSVHPSWRPYMLGRWSWTRHGWYWDSYEPFGWAVYHYGRWHYDDYYGWIWIPDNEWGPAWVEWRYDDDYIGWAPLPPYAHFRIDIGIHFSIGWHSHYSYWNFVRYDRFCHPRVNYYIVEPRAGRRIYERAKYKNNYYYDNDRIVNGGLDRKYVERKAGYKIVQKELRDVDDRSVYKRKRDSSDDRIYTYRPSEREIDRYRNEEIRVSRGEKKLSIERDKISTRTNVDREKVVISGSDRNDSRERPNVRTEKNDNSFERKVYDENKRSRPDVKKADPQKKEYEPKVNRQESERNKERNVIKEQSRSKTSERESRRIDRSGSERKVERKR